MEAPQDDMSAMMVCEWCGSVWTVPNEQRGETVQCTYCGARQFVPLVCEGDQRK